MSDSKAERTTKRLETRSASLQQARAASMARHPSNSLRTALTGYLELDGYLDDQVIPNGLIAHTPGSTGSVILSWHDEDN